MYHKCASVDVTVYICGPVTPVTTTGREPESTTSLRRKAERVY